MQNGEMYNRDYRQKYPVFSISLSDRNYPYLLKTIPAPPKVLYCRGNLPNGASLNNLGIVGTRKITAYGICVLERIFSTLSKSGLCIVSGFMRGVDYYAHLLAVQNNIPTIAVMPCGIDDIYPSTQQKLYEQILDAGGGIISEYAGHTEPRNWMFVKRNRIIAGMCHALLLIEATLNSGSLLTYDFAKRFKRKIYAVPGDIFKDVTQGVCRVLSEGADPVFSGNDINCAFGLPQDNTNILYKDLDSLSSKIINYLKEGPGDIVSIVKATSIDIASLNVRLTALLLRGYIKEQKGMYYVV